MIHFQCPECDKKLGVNESLAGKVGVCPGCKHKFRIPAAAAPAEEVTTAPRRKPEPSPEDRVSKAAPPPPPKRRRVEDDEEPPARDDEPERRPNRRPKKKRRKVSSESKGLVLGLSPLMIALIVAGVFVLLSAGIALIWPPAAMVPMGIGWLLTLGGYIWFLIVAFQDSAMEGLLCFLVPFYFLYFLLTHFEEAKRPFFVYLAGMGLAMFGGCLWAIAGGIAGQH